MNLDGNIDGTDAYLILFYYTQQSVGADTSFLGITKCENVSESVLFKCGDVDEDETISAEDAFYVLKYYAMESVGENPTWIDLISR